MRAEPKILRGVTSRVDQRTISAIDAEGGRFPVGKLEAHERGLLHDAVSVFLFDGRDMLLQRRATGKYHCPGLWANACCTHPDWGETAAAGARRRIHEELGIDVELDEFGETTYRADVGRGLIEHERVRLFRGRVDRAALRFALNPEEVSEVRWADRETLVSEASQAPERLTPWLRIYLERWDALGIAA